MSAILELAQALIARASITPDDAGCQRLLRRRLEQAGFRCEALRFGAVDNLWAVHGASGSLLAFAGHTDVVPPGPEQQWTHPPFTPTLLDGMLYGRGAADMKGGLAAMLVAAERFVSAHPDHPGRLGFLITSDEEGPAVDGTARVMQSLVQRGEKIDWCLIGEPSCQTQFGDTVRHGRRGSLSAELLVHGIQGHVAYPQRADNPIHRLAPALAELCAMHWDQGTADFPATSFQVSNFNAGTGAGNVIPDAAHVRFNFRYSPAFDSTALRQHVAELLQRHGLRHTLTWQSSGEPFLTPAGRFSALIQDAVEKHTGIRPQLDTGGGTSDGRFIAPTGTEVMEFGPLSTSIHQLDECVSVEDLEKLGEIYLAVMQKLLTD